VSKTVSGTKFLKKKMAEFMAKVVANIRKKVLGARAGRTAVPAPELDWVVASKGAAVLHGLGEVGGRLVVESCCLC